MHQRHHIFKPLKRHHRVGYIYSWSRNQPRILPITRYFKFRDAMIFASIEMIRRIDDFTLKSFFFCSKFHFSSIHVFPRETMLTRNHHFILVVAVESRPFPKHFQVKTGFHVSLSLVYILADFWYDCVAMNSLTIIIALCRMCILYTNNGHVNCQLAIFNSII